MPTVLKTFTPVTGGASLVIPETPSAHSKPGSIWNRLKRSLQTVQLSAKKFGEHESRIRGEDGAFYKIGMANEYIQKLEAELSGKSSGSDSTAVAQLTSEN